MKPNPRLLFASSVFYVVLACWSASAATRYVNINSVSPAAPYSSWATAAADIQAALDVAAAGDLILVTNGLYQTGGTWVGGGINRVAVTKPVLVQSVNGPAFTTIVGSRQPGATNGWSAIRCVYLINGAVLSGFTLTNGATQSSGSSTSGGGVWCQSTSAVVTNCVLTGNSADNDGGGAFNGTLNNCTLTGNSARHGGGASQGTLNNCTLTGNSASLDGGGAYFGTLNNCIVYYNLAGSYYNLARSDPNYSYSTLNYSCTMPLPSDGEGNISAEPQLASLSHISAGSPCRGAGSPAHASGLDLDGEPWANPPSIGCDEYWNGSVTGAMSVAIKVGNTNVALGFAVDFQALITGRVGASRWDYGDGMIESNRPYASHSWATPGNYVVELRAFNESYPAGVAAVVTVRVEDEVLHVSMGSTNPVAPYSTWATAAADIQAAVDVAALPGALVRVGDGVYQTGAMAVDEMSNRVAVTKPVLVQSVNGPAYTSIVGFRHPGATNGASAIRCVYLTNGAVLSGFTLTNGATQISGYVHINQAGGGVWCQSTSAVVTNCVLTGNSARDGGGAYDGTLNNCVLTGNSASVGGGASQGTLNNCALTGNSASSYGGGAGVCTLNNCTLTGNSAGSGGGAGFCTLNNCTLSGNSASSDGGGAYQGTVNNCIVYYNSAPFGPNFDYNSTLNYSCTTPLWSAGGGNISAGPLFVNTNGWSDLRLQSNSPCVNAGNNSLAAGNVDLDGLPRVSGGIVDMGAYEFQAGADGSFEVWLRSYGLPSDGSADSTDADRDGHNNRQEWVAGTNPTNALSVLRLGTPQVTPSSVVLSWSSVTNRAYTLEQAFDLREVFPFTVIQSNIPGLPGATSWMLTNAPGAAPRYYRVRTQN